MTARCGNWLAAGFRHRRIGLTVFAAVVFWTMVDSYTRPDAYRAVSELQIGADEPPERSQLVEVGLRSEDPALAARALNAMVDAYVARSETDALRAQVIKRAEPPVEPLVPGHGDDLYFALGLGLLCGTITIFVANMLDGTLRTPADVARRLRLRVLGVVPGIEGDRLPLLSRPVAHELGDAYREIRSALVAQLDGGRPRMLAVTSTQAGEGKTTTAINLAMALANGGGRVLLIDADMRTPGVHAALRLSNDRGLSQLLAGRARLRDVVQRTHDPNLMVVTAGRTPASPAELLASDRMRALAEGLDVGPFDWIVVDTPPALEAADAALVSAFAAGIVFVVGAAMTGWREAEQALAALPTERPGLVTTVLNRVEQPSGRRRRARVRPQTYVDPLEASAT